MGMTFQANDCDLLVCHLRLHKRTSCLLWIMARFRISRYPLRRRRCLSGSRIRLLKFSATLLSVIIVRCIPNLGLFRNRLIKYSTRVAPILGCSPFTVSIHILCQFLIGFSQTLRNLVVVLDNGSSKNSLTDKRRGRQMVGIIVLLPSHPVG